MGSKRTMTNIARKTGVSSQNMQHFVSESPWSGAELIGSIRDSISQRGEFQVGSVLVVDESADEKAGDHSAGAGRQHNGRLGKVDMSQVGVFLSLVNGGYHTWIDGELYLPKQWFEADSQERRERAGIPDNRHFQTKLELGLQMIKRAQAEGVPFAAVAFDTLYGRKGWLRDEFDESGIEYYADTPANTKVYLSEPQVVWPETRSGQKAKQYRVASPRYPYMVKDLLNHPKTLWRTITLRPNERGFLKADFARHRVWTVREDGSVRQEWLLIRRDAKRLTYSFSNAPVDCPLPTMAARKSQRYFIERSNQDAKSELGWDEFQAIKYRAWQHHLALTIAASWFITETRLDWALEFERDPDLLAHYEMDVLPALSMANVRELLRATLPLPHLSTLDAAALVVEHLDNRTRSRKSRLRYARSP
jgi:SRSO17 transposase